MDKQKIILVVDDDEATRELERNVLESAGYKIIIAESGDEAVQKIAEGADIDLILTDVNIPGELDGIAAAAEIIKLRPDLENKIIFCSSDSYNEERVPGKTFLAKPFSPLSGIVQAVKEKLG